MQITCETNNLEQHPSAFLTWHSRESIAFSWIEEDDRSVPIVRFYAPTFVRSSVDPSIIPSKQPNNGPRNAREYQHPCYCEYRPESPNRRFFATPEAYKACGDGEADYVSTRRCPSTSNVWWLAQVFGMIAIGNGTEVWAPYSDRQVKKWLRAGKFPELPESDLDANAKHFVALTSSMFRKRPSIAHVLKELQVLCGKTGCRVPQCAPVEETAFPFRGLYR